MILFVWFTEPLNSFLVKGNFCLSVFAYIKKFCIRKLLYSGFSSKLVMQKESEFMNDF